MSVTITHNLLFALSHIFSNLLLLIDAGDLDYNDEIVVISSSDKIRVLKGEATIIETKLT